MTRAADVGELAWALVVSFVGSGGLETDARVPLPESEVSGFLVGVVHMLWVPSRNSPLRGGKKRQNIKRKAPKGQKTDRPRVQGPDPQHFGRPVVYI